jgi:hypothetical protein
MELDNRPVLLGDALCERRPCHLRRIEGGPVPLREVRAFGGGLHLATPDVYRAGSLED